MKPLPYILLVCGVACALMAGVLAGAEMWGWAAVAFATWLTYAYLAFDEWDYQQQQAR